MICTVTRQVRPKVGNTFVKILLGILICFAFAQHVATADTFRQHSQFAATHISFVQAPHHSNSIYDSHFRIARKPVIEMKVFAGFQRGFKTKRVSQETAPHQKSTRNPEVLACQILAAMLKSQFVATINARP
jgi:hypothetical protein